MTDERRETHQINRAPIDTTNSIYFKTPFNNTVADVMTTRGWTRVTDNEPHHLHWCDVSWLRENFDNSYLPENLKICHYRNHYELTRKNLMVKNLKRLKKNIKKLGGSDTLDFFPMTYELPMEYHIFVEEFKRNKLEHDNELARRNAMEKSETTKLTALNIPTYIMKPVGRAQGRGIFLFRRLKDIIDWRRTNQDAPKSVNPGYANLINSNTSERHMIQPAGLTDNQNNAANLTNNQGLPVNNSGPNANVTANLNSQPTDNPNSNTLASKAAENQSTFVVENYVVSRYIDNPYLIMGKKFDIRMYVLVTSFSPLVVWMHREGFARFSNQRFSLENIDNAIVHLTNVAIQKTDVDYDPEKGSKWSLESLRRYLSHRHGHDKIDEVFKQMNRIVIRSLQSVKKTIISDKHCFELYGYDLMLDENLKLWLIEINSSPSLSASSLEDYQLKFGLLWDTFDVIDIENNRSKKEFRVGGYDLIWCEDESFFKDNPHYNFINKDAIHGKDGENEESDNRQNLTNGKVKTAINSRKNAQDEILSSVLANHSVQADPIIHNSWLFKQLPSYSTNNFCGCPYDRQKIVLEEC